MPVPFDSVAPMPRRVPSMHRSMELDDGCEPNASSRSSMDNATSPRPDSLDQSSPGHSHSHSGPENGPAQSQCQDDRNGPSYAESTNIFAEPEASISDGIVSSQNLASDCSHSGTSLVVSGRGVPSPIDAMAAEESFSNAAKAPETAHSQTQECANESMTPDIASPPARLVSDHSNTEEQSPGGKVNNAATETPSATSSSAASRESESSRRGSRDPATPSLAARRRSNVYSLQPGLMDLQSFVQDLDDAGLLHDEDVSGKLDSSQYTSYPAGANAGANVHALLARTNKALEDEAGRISTYRGIREPAVPSAITRLKSDVSSERRQSADDLQSVILAPQPVSPARQLRLRSSVSKLMKALPPVPAGSAFAEQESIVNKPLAERKLPELSALPRVSLFGLGQSAGPSYKPRGADESANIVPKVPVPASIADIHTAANHDIYGDIWDVHFGRAADPSTVDASAESCSPVRHDMMEDAGDNLKNHGGLGNGARQMRSLSQRGKFRCGTVRSKPRLTLRQTSAQMNPISHPRGASLDSSRSTLQRPPVPPKHAVPVDRHGLVNSGVRPQRGLKKRLSDFKIRLTESRHRPGHRSSTDIRVEDDGEVIGLAVPVASSSVSPESGGGTSNTNSATDEASARGLRCKLSRWMKSARNAANTCKRLSSSTGGTSLDTDF